MPMTIRRASVLAANGLLVVAIVGIIGATWMPAVYSSQWFQHNRWVRAHLLDDDRPGPATPQRK